MFKVQGSNHLITTSSNHLIIIFVLCFLLLLGVTSCFGQQMKAPKDAPHFVYPTSVALAYGIGNTFNGSDMVANGNISCEIQQVFAYQFTNYFFTGVGAGLDFWFYDKKTSTFIPIFANATVKLMDKKTAPFIFTNIGYAFKWQVQNPLDEDVFYGTKAGIHFQSGLGVNLKFSEKISLLFAAYYKMQQSANKFRESDLVLAETSNQLFHFIGIKISILY
ncbi:MAG: hypothetical protein FWF70_01830 [Bacteroidetes bacterium]|nr:hypothetical protein [Bacteroidota bacterium]MCL1969091.1 hypothetical protein [Bacteroidota bacterium]